MHRVGQSGEEARDGMPELTRSELKPMPVDYDVAQVLVATNPLCT